MSGQNRTTLAILAAISAVPIASLLLSSSPPAPASGPPAATPTTPAPTPPTPAGPSLVSASAQLQSSHVLVGASETFVAVTVTGAELERRERPPLNLAVVIDRSGSMAGEKLSNAKRAAATLVKELTPRDRVALVSYGSDVVLTLPSTVADETGRTAALAAIETIYDDGGTNLSGGLEAGRDQILPFHTDGYVSRVVLISDGLANEGITDKNELARLASASAEHGVAITTIGVGLDFDEQLMTRVAIAGTGRYYFVEDSSQLAELFESELGGLGAVVGTAVSLEIEPAAGVTLRSAFGYDIEWDEGIARIVMPDLRGGETRKVVLHVAVDAAEEGPLSIANFRVNYRPVDEMATDSSAQVVEFAAHAEATKSVAAVEGNLSKEATRLIERARTSKALEDATAYYERGELESARRVLSERRSETVRMARAVADEELAEELAPLTLSTESEFAGADRARGSAADKRARKASRKKAYDLAR